MWIWMAVFSCASHKIRLCNGIHTTIDAFLVCVCVLNFIINYRLPKCDQILRKKECSPHCCADVRFQCVFAARSWNWTFELCNSNGPVSVDDQQLDSSLVKENMWKCWKRIKSQACYSACLACNVHTKHEELAFSSTRWKWIDHQSWFKTFEKKCLAIKNEDKTTISFKRIASVDICSVCSWILHSTAFNRSVLCRAQFEIVRHRVQIEAV